MMHTRVGAFNESHWGGMSMAAEDEQQAVSLRQLSRELGFPEPTPELFDKLDEAALQRLSEEAEKRDL